MSVNGLWLVWNNLRNIVVDSLRNEAKKGATVLTVLKPPIFLPWHSQKHSNAGSMEGRSHAYN